jgi:hypothetical protein
MIELIIGILALIFGIIGTIIAFYSLYLFLKDKKLERNKFSIKYEPDPSIKVTCVDVSEYRIRVRFFCKRGNVIVYKIWQHQGGLIGVAKMKIIDSKTKEPIRGSDSYTFIVQENIPRNITLVFTKDNSFSSSKDLIGFRIETSEGIFEKEFNIQWID